MARIRRLAFPMALLIGLSAATAQESILKIPGFGVAFEPPTAWVRKPEMAFSQLARFVRLEGDELRGILEVDIAPLRGRTIGDIATKLATDRSGAVLGRRQVDAGTALEVRLAPAGPFAASVVGVLQVHDQAVVISCGEVDEATALAAMRGVLASLKPSDPQPASVDLSLRALDIPLFDSNVRLRLPEAFRPTKVQKPDNEFFWGARNWSNGKDEASVQGQLIPNPHHAPLDAMIAVAGPQLRERLKLDAPLTFEKVQEDPEVQLSSVFATTPTESQRFAYVAVSQEKTALLVFRSTADPDARRRYMEMAMEVCKGIREAE